MSGPAPPAEAGPPGSNPSRSRLAHVQFATAVEQAAADDNKHEGASEYPNLRSRVDHLHRAMEKFTRDGNLDELNAATVLPHVAPEEFYIPPDSNVEQLRFTDDIDHVTLITRDLSFKVLMLPDANREPAALLLQTPERKQRLPESPARPAIPGPEQSATRAAAAAAAAAASAASAPSAASAAAAASSAALPPGHAAAVAVQPAAPPAAADAPNTNSLLLFHTLGSAARRGFGESLVVRHVQLRVPKQVRTREQSAAAHHMARDAAAAAALQHAIDYEQFEPFDDAEEADATAAKEPEPLTDEEDDGAELPVPLDGEEVKANLMPLSRAADGSKPSEKCRSLCVGLLNTNQIYIHLIEDAVAKRGDPLVFTAEEKEQLMFAHASWALEAFKQNRQHAELTRNPETRRTYVPDCSRVPVASHFKLSFGN